MSERMLLVAPMSDVVAITDGDSGWVIVLVKRIRGCELYQR